MALLKEMKERLQHAFDRNEQQEQMLKEDFKQKQMNWEDQEKQLEQVIRVIRRNNWGILLHCVNE